MSNRVRKAVFASCIAALYAALTLILMPISFNEYQFRISEVLAILPYFFPFAVPGLFVGCIIANILSPYGFADMVIGSTATLFAAIVTMRMGKSRNSEALPTKALACLPPVIINAVFIGALIAYSATVGARNADAFWPTFLAFALQVGFGQAVVIYILGLPLMIYLPRMGVIDKLKQIYEINEEEEEK